MCPPVTVSGQFTTIGQFATKGADNRLVSGEGRGDIGRGSAMWKGVAMMGKGCN